VEAIKKGKVMTDAEIELEIDTVIGRRFRPSGTRPNYLMDLNAMHEAERTLRTREQRRTYIKQLWALENRWEYRSDIQGSYWPMLHATAAQRAEAFLRSICKWKEETT